MQKKKLQGKWFMMNYPLGVYLCYEWTNKIAEFDKFDKIKILK